MMPVSMVGRAGELAEFAAAWAMVTGGRRRAGGVVVTGAAGVGKSLLIAAALDGLTPRPATILTGTARVHTPAPYDWLAAALSGRDTRDLPLPPDALAWLAQHPNAPRNGTPLTRCYASPSAPYGRWWMPARRCWWWRTCTPSTRPA